MRPDTDHRMFPVSFFKRCPGGFILFCMLSAFFIAPLHVNGQHSELDRNMCAFTRSSGPIQDPLMLSDSLEGKSGIYFTAADSFMHGVLFNNSTDTIALITIRPMVGRFYMEVFDEGQWKIAEDMVDCWPGCGMGAKDIYVTNGQQLEFLLTNFLSGDTIMPVRIGAELISIDCMHNKKPHPVYHSNVLWVEISRALLEEIDSTYYSTNDRSVSEWLQEGNALMDRSEYTLAIEKFNLALNIPGATTYARHQILECYKRMSVQPAY
ncbi:MAG: hypothetical protein R2794_04025 [Chitinophagales bacterium]